MDILALTAASILALAGGDSITLKPLETGATAKIGNYAPQKVELSTDRPSSLHKIPDDLKAPLYGSLTMNKKKVYIIVDEPEGADARLFVDSNADGDATNDATAEWKVRDTATNREGKKYQQYNGGAKVSLGDKTPFDAHVSMYRFDKTDPARAQQKNTLFAYSDYAVEGEADLAGKTYKVMLVDTLLTGDFSDSKVKFKIDVNGNGKFDYRGESFSVNEPFNIGGTTYELKDLAHDGSTATLAKSDKKVDEIPPSPDLSVGKTILAFNAKKMDGSVVHFPADYKGKVVLIDFWATWCGPCMGEMPNVSAAYKAHHKNGFEILGISLDNEKAESKIKDAEEAHEMKWPQVYDGKGWKAEIATMYDIHSIPASFLINGDTGEILGTGLRGEALNEAVAKALKDKGKS